MKYTAVARTADFVGDASFKVVKFFLPVVLVLMLLMSYRYLQEGSGASGLGEQMAYSAGDNISGAFTHFSPAESALLDSADAAVQAVSDTFKGDEQREHEEAYAKHAGELKPGSGTKFITQAEYERLLADIENLPSEYWQYDEVVDPYALDARVQDLRGLSADIKSFRENFSCDPGSKVQVQSFDGLSRISCVAMRDVPNLQKVFIA